jgi:hypothetical protein
MQPIIGRQPKRAELLLEMLGERRLAGAWQPTREEEGWTQRFHRRLRIEVSRRYWRRLARNDDER